MGKLTDTKLRSLTAKGKYYDGGGLYIYIFGNGGNSWRIDYRYEGKSKTLTIGTYPSLTLAMARKRLAESKEQLANGIDPSAHKQAVKLARRDAQRNAFEVIAREWLANQAHTWTPKHQKKILSRLEMYIFPLLGGKEVKAITAPELLEAPRIIEAKGHNDTAHSTLNTCGAVFRYAIATGRGERDTSADLRGALKPKVQSNYPSIKDPKQIGILLQNIDDYQGNVVVRMALQFAPYVFVRPSELRCAVWSEFDLENAEWRIPAERMKKRQVHIVPLAVWTVKQK